MTPEVLTLTNVSHEFLHLKKFLGVPWSSAEFLWSSSKFHRSFATLRRCLRSSIGGKPLNDSRYFSIIYISKVRYFSIGVEKNINIHLKTNQNKQMTVHLDLICLNNIVLDQIETPQIRLVFPNCYNRFNMAQYNLVCFL